MNFFLAANLQGRRNVRWYWMMSLHLTLAVILAGESWSSFFVTNNHCIPVRNALGCNHVLCSYFLFDSYLTVHHWNKLYRQPNRCNSNCLLIIQISWTCFGRLFRSSSGTLDCVYSLWYNAPTMLPAGSLEAEGLQLLRFQASGRQHRGCIIQQAVNTV
jgi:hypothetical protein